MTKVTKEKANKNNTKKQDSPKPKFSEDKFSSDELVNIYSVALHTLEPNSFPEPSKEALDSYEKNRNKINPITILQLMQIGISATSQKVEQVEGSIFDVHGRYDVMIQFLQNKFNLSEKELEKDAKTAARQVAKRKQEAQKKLEKEIADKQEQLKNTESKKKEQTETKYDDTVVPMSKKNVTSKKKDKNSDTKGDKNANK